MRVKLYAAPGMPEAIARIREELGNDAVILSSRRVAGGVEVTASVESPEPALLPLPVFREGVGGRVPPPEPAQSPNCLLRAHGTPEPLAGKLRAGPLPFALSVVLRFLPLDAAALQRP